MKKLAVIAIALCTCAIACGRDDTVRDEQWREPRLTICCPVEDARDVNCNAEIQEHSEAIAVLRHCTDTAIEALERLAADDPKLWSDVSAAYYVSAQKDDPGLYLHALSAANRALQSNPRLEEALANRIFAERQLGLSGDAGAAAAARWYKQIPRLESAMQAGDQQTVERLIEDFPRTAEAHFATLLQNTDRPPGIGTFAAALSKRLGGDRFPIHALTQKNVVALRAEVKSIAHPDFAGDPRPRLEELERIARTNEYRHLLVRILATRALAEGDNGQFGNSLQSYRAALEESQHLRDFETVATLRTAISGVLREAGDVAGAARENHLALRDLHRLVSMRDRHVILGEAALIARAYGHPEIALLYQDQAVAIAATVSEESEEDVRRNRAIAHRKRAAIHMDLASYAKAKRDLQMAIAFAEEVADEAIRASLQANDREIEGRLQLRTMTDPARAEKLFSEALELAAPNPYPTFRARLYIQRAEARRLLGRRMEARADLEAAVQEIRREGDAMLANRKLSESEEIWVPYFSRFQDTYRLLIREYLESGDHKEAFRYAEMVRAKEPLDLLKRMQSPPAAVREIMETYDLARIQRELPDDTFILQYSVLEDRVYVFILGKNHFDIQSLPVPRERIERWTRELHTAASRNRRAAFERGLYAPYAELIAEPLKQVLAWHGRPEPRIIFVPDGAMHGLPFSALRDRDGYLVEKATLSNAGSSTLAILSILRDRELRHDNFSLFLVGNPDFSTSLPSATRLAPLPEAVTEVQRLQVIYSGAPITARMGAEATTADFLAQAGRHSVVHFAGHSVVNRQRPERSALLLAATNIDQGELRARDLPARLQLPQTRLVILSSCSSVGGAPVGPEGVAPLVRPFIAAGASGVIGALWDVEDATTKEFMVSLHSEYRSGKDAAAALQAAQRKALGSPIGALAWAPYQVIGYSSSPYGAAHTMKEGEEPP